MVPGTIQMGESQQRVQQETIECCKILRAVGKRRYSNAVVERDRGEAKIEEITKSAVKISELLRSVGAINIEIGMVGQERNEEEWE